MLVHRLAVKTWKGQCVSSLIGKLRMFTKGQLMQNGYGLLLLARLKSQVLFHPQCSVRSNEFVEMSLVLCTCKTSMDLVYHI